LAMALFLDINTNAHSTLSRTDTYNTNTQFEMPKMPDLPNPFGGGKKETKPAAKTATKTAVAQAADVDKEEEEDE